MGVSIGACKQVKTPYENWQDLKPKDFTNLIENAYDFIDTPFFDSICGWLNDTLKQQTYAYIYIHDEINLENNKIIKSFSTIISKRYSMNHYDLRHKDNLPICLISKDSIFVRDERIQYSNIVDLAKEYLANPCNNEILSEKREVDIDLLGKLRVSKGILELKFRNIDKRPLTINDWKIFFSIIDKFNQAYFELRNEFAQMKFGKTYNELDFEYKVAITKLYPTNIDLNFLFNCDVDRIIPPPPPPN